jgi:glycosyltransferase involved in cell wall biosynthesis
MDLLHLQPPAQSFPALTPPNGPTSLSVVVPAYNEQEVLPEFHRRLSAVLKALQMPCEVVYVNDGSRDATLDVMTLLSQQDAQVTVVNLSRNFGKEIAMTAGLDHAVGEAVVVIDADLQDPPEMIPQMVAEWQAGYDVVYAQRTHRDGESWVKKATAKLFYRVIGRMTNIDIPPDTGDFRLMSRRVVDALLKLRERHRFMKGLFAWVGFSQKALPYRRDARGAGVTKFNYWKLWNFAIEGITSFSSAPLKFSTYLGTVIAALAFLYGSFIIARTLLLGNPVPGYPSLIVIVLFLGGVQLTAIGVLGEYIGRMFDETKHRPLYLVQGLKRSALGQHLSAAVNPAVSPSDDARLAATPTPHRVKEPA